MGAIELLMPPFRGKTRENRPYRHRCVARMAQATTLPTIGHNRDKIVVYMLWWCWTQSARAMQLCRPGQVVPAAPRHGGASGVPVCMKYSCRTDDSLRAANVADDVRVEADRRVGGDRQQAIPEHGRPPAGGCRLLSRPPLDSRGIDTKNRSDACHTRCARAPAGSTLGGTTQ